MVLRRGAIARSIPIRRADDVDAGFERAVREQAHGVILLSSPLIFRQRAQIAGLALNARLPTISLFTGFPKLGGMMAYGPDFPLIYRQAAKYVGRIVAGANPAELPIQRPTKFDLVVNVKTAKAIGVTVPETLLVRADEVIE
jgi:putative ABC transport system substrate-binding protein